MPSSVARALREAEHDDHPDVPWRPPELLPPADALEMALAMLTPLPACDRTIRTCLAQLVIAFEPNTRLSAEATRLRVEVWKQANADLGDVLWREATDEAIRSLKWMPKPAEFRELVRSRLDRRNRERRRCEQMLAEQARRRRAAPARPLPTREDRLRELIAIYAKHDRPADVDRLGRELQQLLQRKAMP